MLAENLSSLLGPSNAVAVPWTGTSTADYRVIVRFAVLDGEIGGEAEVRALWTVTVGGLGDEVAVQSFHARESVDGEGAEALVAAQSRLLLALSRDIADAIEKRMQADWAGHKARRSWAWKQYERLKYKTHMAKVNTEKMRKLKEHAQREIAETASSYVQTELRATRAMFAMAGGILGGPIRYKIVEAYMESCCQGKGAFIGEKLGVSSSGYVNVGGQIGYGLQLLALCDEGEVCLYYYRPPHYVLPGGGAGTPGASASIDWGLLFGHGVFEKHQYTGPFIHAGVSAMTPPTPLGSFGIQAGSSSWPGTTPGGGQGSFNPLSQDPYGIWGPKAPTSYELALSWGISTPPGGVGGGITPQVYGLVGCVFVF